MILALLAAGLVIWWAWRKGVSRGHLVALCSAAAGVFLSLRGNWQVGLPMILPVIWLLVGDRVTASPPPSGQMDGEEARRVLGVPRGADEAAIREAHRRLVAKVHPDQGGSADLAIRVNAARDVLLAELGRRYPR